MVSDAEFQSLTIKHMYQILADQEEFKPTHWVKSDAVKASNMKKSETIR